MKILKVLGGILFAGGIFLSIVAAGGLEQDICSYTEFWQMAGCGLMMLMVGGLCLQD